jgi:polyvinyl alcohol dehydrogenase (cytochrome)
LWNATDLLLAALLKTEGAMNGALGWVKAICSVAACGCLMTTPAALADEESGDGQWTMGGQNLSNTRHQDDTEISPQNVAHLKLKWTFTATNDITATPAVANGVVYFPDFAGNYYAVNARTGALVWQKTVGAWTGITGDYARNDPAIYHTQSGDLVILGNQAGYLAKWNGSALINGHGASIIAVNAVDGSLKWQTQAEAWPAAAITGSPVVYNGVIYVGVATAEEGLATNDSYPCCTGRGSVVALDVRTGAKLWQTYTVPNNGGNPGGYSGGAVWGSTPVVDPKRNQLYVGVGNNYSVPIKDELCVQNSKNGGANCDDANDHFDSMLALDLQTGAVKWSARAWPYDAWNVACITGGINCPTPHGPDYDLGGSGPNLLSHNSNGNDDDLVGVGQKSGLYWTFNARTGKVLWNTQVGPGSTLGGIEWGTATDGKRIYVPISNLLGIPYTLQPSGALANGGSWSALDPKTGKILWQTPTPGTCSISVPSYTQGCMALGPTSVANEVVFAGSMNRAAGAPTMFALDARTGKILWSYPAGSEVVAAPAIVGNSIYWGSGYRHFGLGSGNNTLFAFSVDRDREGPH